VASSSSASTSVLDRNKCPGASVLSHTFVCGLRSVAFALITSCAYAPPEPPPPGVASIPAPVVKQGEFWEYAVRDAYTGAPRGLYRYTVKGAGADAIVVEVTRDGQPFDTYRYTPGWQGLEHPLRNLQRFRYTPAYPAYVFPLYPGQSWRVAINSTDAATGRTYRTHIHATVGGWRRIKVPAGEFDAIAVRRYVYAGNAEFFRLQEEIVETDWYAPAVSNAVLSEGTSSHIDTSRGGGGRNDPPLRVRGDWLVAELVRHGAQ
jgi:hypothetical protein